VWPNSLLADQAAGGDRSIGLYLVTVDGDDLSVDNDG